MGEAFYWDPDLIERGIPDMNQLGMGQRSVWKAQQTCWAENMSYLHDNLHLFCECSRALRCMLLKVGHFAPALLNLLLQVVGAHVNKTSDHRLYMHNRFGFLKTAWSQCTKNKKAEEWEREKKNGWLSGSNSPGSLLAEHRGRLCIVVEN